MKEQSGQHSIADEKMFLRKLGRCSTHTSTPRKKLLKMYIKTLERRTKFDWTKGQYTDVPIEAKDIPKIKEELINYANELISQ